MKIFFQSFYQGSSSRPQDEGQAEAHRGHGGETDGRTWTEKKVEK